MHEQEEKQFAHRLRKSLAPMNRELDRDLWPKMLRRIDDRAAGRQWWSVMFSSAALARVPWFDWALLATLVAGVCAFPGSIPIWLYHL